MTAKIHGKIVDYRIRKSEAEQGVSVPDQDPLLKRIDSRPEGTLEAVSQKVTYFTQEGRQKVYILVSFLPVEGVLDGDAVVIERPIEFFFPVGQLSSEYQWISATMRSLSLAARGGYAAQNLRDLRKVTWDKGPVRCGRDRWGKPIYHDSEVAAIAWAIQKILQARGFLDEHGEQIPSRDLAAAYANRQSTGVVLDDDDEEDGDAILSEEPEGLDEPTFGQDSVGAARVKPTCRECGSEVQFSGGCSVCTGCGASAC